MLPLHTFETDENGNKVKDPKTNKDKMVKADRYEVYQSFWTTMIPFMYAARLVLVFFVALPLMGVFRVDG
eukprot:3302910-Rhodomonas_salina.1